MRRARHGGRPAPPGEHAMPEPMVPESRMGDGGPRYLETDTARLIAEPWNAVTAALFLGIAVWYAVRLVGRYRRHPFLGVCVPLLAVGGVGGTLYHALRNSPVWFVLDAGTIAVLGLLAVLYLWVRLVPRVWILLVVAGAFVAANLAAGALLRTSLGVNGIYAVQAAMILLPILGIQIRTRFRHGVLVALGLASFAVALLFRAADAWRPPLLPMGTHWLWHVFGALTTLALAEYLYRLEPEPLALPARDVSGS